MLASRSKGRGSSARVRNFPIPTESICPECLCVIEATIIERDGSVIMSKQCAEHGCFEELLSTDVNFFLRMHNLVFEDGPGVSNPQSASARGCPYDCGLCDRHLSLPTMAVIDLTNRCNLNCPICFANANVAGYIYEVTVDQVCRMLDMLANLKPSPAACVQFSGGEPTIHKDFVRVLAEAHKRGFAQVQVATNGIRFATDLDFTRRCADAGLHIVYLQFDGLDDQIYRAVRGRPLTDLKKRAVENIYAAGMRTVLVPTISKGINDSQIGPILNYAVDHIREISAISWQPVTFTGRIDQSERRARRFTLADLAREMENQTGLVSMHRDWFPLSYVSPFSRLVEATTAEPTLAITCHGHCGVGTFLIVNADTRETVPLPAFFDCIKGMAAMDRMADALTTKSLMKKWSLARAFQSLEKCYDPACAPEGWDFREFMRFMESYVDFRVKFHDNRSRRAELDDRPWRALLLASMHFQDAYTYELDRIRRCVVQYASPDGKLYPSGPCYRQTVERRFAVSSARAPRRSIRRARRPIKAPP